MPTVGEGWSKELTSERPRWRFQPRTLQAVVAAVALTFGAMVYVSKMSLNEIDTLMFVVGTILVFYQSFDPLSGPDNLFSVGGRDNIPAFSSGLGNRLRQPVGPRVQAQEANDR